MADPVFYYDLSSPYAYLAARRVDDLLPGVVWRPIAFGFLLRHHGRVPWSLSPGRERDMEEIAARAAARGLPPVVYPPGWPKESYSLDPLRACVHAEREGALKEFTLAAYEQAFAHERALADHEVLADAARAAGLDPDPVLAALDDREVRDRLKAYTDEAIERGVEGIPTVAVGGELFWGDDRLEDAARAAVA